jgi:lipoprotein-releasing system permease protein
VRRSLVLHVAARYFRTRRRDRGNVSSLLSVAGIAVGVMTLTVVLGVMNGFQLGFIEAIVGVSSYHLQLEPGQGAAGAASRGMETAAGLTAPLAERVRRLPGVTAVVPFVQRQALVTGAFQRPRACMVRAVPPDLFDLDPSQERLIEVQDGSFDLRGPHSVVLGAELAAAMGVRVGDVVSLVSYAAGPDGRPAPRRDSFEVTGLFRTGYFDFDSGLLFMSLPAADALYGNGAPLPRSYGVKIASRFDDARALRRIGPLLGGSGYTAAGWRSYNRSFFDALLMEKLMMMLLVGLIFVVVGFNVYHSLRRGVYERMEEIAVLKAMGIPPLRIQSIFVIEGLFIGLLGGLIGIAAGLALAVNVSGFFSAVEAVVNGVLRVARDLATPFAGGGGAGSFAIFSPRYFYLTQVPSRVFPEEAFLVCFFAVAACVGAAWAASRAVSRFSPAEVLRYE